MDDQYLKDVLAGKINAYRYFVNKYQDMAFSLSMSIVKSELVAEEAVQDAFVRAYQNIRSFRKKSKFSTWFYKIVVNESLRKLKKKQLDMVPLDDLPEPGISIKEVLQPLHEVEQREIINDLLLKLPPSESLLLRLFYLEENTQEEIKLITGLSISNIKVTLHRARKRFYAILKESYKNEYNSLL